MAPELQAELATLVPAAHVLLILLLCTLMGLLGQGRARGSRAQGRRHTQSKFAEPAGRVQVTGRNEYTQFGATVGMTAGQASQYLETPAGAAMSGCWYLSSNGCLPLAEAWNISEITRRVNGSAMEANAQRIAYSNAILQALGG
jgi:predicted chitinase